MSDRTELESDGPGRDHHVPGARDDLARAAVGPEGERAAGRRITSSIASTRRLGNL